MIVSSAQTVGHHVEIKQQKAAGFIVGQHPMTTDESNGVGIINTIRKEATSTRVRG